MAFFKRRKDSRHKDEDEEELNEELDTGRGSMSLKKKLPRDKDFKDLNPVDRRKRKEPARPWGKKERLLILVLVLVTAGISGYLGISARNYKLPGLPRLKVPNFSIEKFFQGETIILEGSQSDKVKTEKVINGFNEKVDDLSGVYGLMVVRLNDGVDYGVNVDEVFQAASLIKLPLMVGMYLEAEKGNIDLDSKYTLKSSDKVGGAGSLYSMPAGYQITYRNLIRLMGKQSDNTAFNICRKLLGDREIDEVAISIGMKNTNIENNETSPRDIGIFFEELWNGNILKKDEKDELLEFLTDTAFESLLPQGLPDGIRIAHKVGIETHVVNDAGIIYTQSPIVVAVLSKGIIEKEANQILPEVAKLVLDTEVNN